MKNPLIAERLKFYRKKNNLTIPQVSELLSEGVRISIFRLENNLSLQRINESALTGDTEFIREITVNMSDWFHDIGRLHNEYLQI